MEHTANSSIGSNAAATATTARYVTALTHETAYTIAVSSSSRRQAAALRLQQHPEQLSQQLPPLPLLFLLLTPSVGSGSDLLLIQSYRYANVVLSPLVCADFHELLCDGLDLLLVIFLKCQRGIFTHSICLVS